MNLSRIKSTIAALHASSVALFLHGAPGCGKTAIVEQAGAELGVQVMTFRTNLMEPVDFGGLPSPTSDGKVTWLMPDFLPQEGTTGIIFLDEFPQAPIATQCAAMRLVDTLPKAWQVIAAGNRAKDRAGAGQIATHVLSRFTHLDVDVSCRDWQEWALLNGIRYEVRAFVDFRPELLFDFDPAKVQEERGNCSPRSWHRMSRIIESGINDVEVFAGTIGRAPASEFAAFLTDIQNHVTLDEILADPANCKIPDELSCVYAVCSMLAAKAFEDKSIIKQVAVYAVRLRLEFAMMLMLDLIALEPSIVKSPAVAKWVVQNQDSLGNARK